MKLWQVIPMNRLIRTVHVN